MPTGKFAPPVNDAEGQKIMLGEGARVLLHCDTIKKRPDPAEKDVAAKAAEAPGPDGLATGTWVGGWPVTKDYVKKEGAPVEVWQKVQLCDDERRDENGAMLVGWVEQKVLQEVTLGSTADRVTQITAECDFLAKDNSR